MNIFIGNLSREVSDDDLRELFTSYGEVTSANVIKDKISGQSRGFGFVEMASKTAAKNAITELNGKELKGWTINVNEARPRPNNRDAGGKKRGGPSNNRGRRTWSNS
jgi:RNA recognition motif-containing protein